MKRFDHPTRRQTSPFATIAPRFLGRTTISVMTLMAAISLAQSGHAEEPNSPALEHVAVEVAAIQPTVAAANVADEHTVDANVAVDVTVALGNVDRAIAKEKLTRLITETKTAKWNTKVCETLGEKIEESTTENCWAGVDMQRIKVLTGRAAGKTLFIRGEKVHAGWLKFHHSNSMVKTIRGNSLRLNGFFDDIEAMLLDWDNVVIDDVAGTWVFNFHAPTGLESRMHLNPANMIVIKMEAFEDGQKVGCYEYDSVVYNPELPARTWRK